MVILPPGLSGIKFPDQKVALLLLSSLGTCATKTLECRCLPSRQAELQYCISTLKYQLSFQTQSHAGEHCGKSPAYWHLPKENKAAKAEDAHLICCSAKT